MKVIHISEKIDSNGMQNNTFLFDDDCELQIINHETVRFGNLHLRVTNLKTNESDGIFYSQLCNTKHVMSDLLLLNYTVADRLYYVFTYCITYIRFYKSVGEYLSLYNNIFTYYKHLDIKHSLWNLRKANKFEYFNMLILNNVDEYNEYCKTSKFAREMIINFYARFIKLSDLKNNKKLSWILNKTETFMYYGFVSKSKEVSLSCRFHKIRLYDSSYPYTAITEQVTDATFDLLPLPTVTPFPFAKFKSIHPDSISHYNCNIIQSLDKCCKYIRKYKSRVTNNLKFGIRQNTKEFIKWQVYNKQFKCNGHIGINILTFFKTNVVIKTRTAQLFQLLLHKMNSCNTQKLKDEFKLLLINTLKLNSKTISGTINRLTSTEIDMLLNSLTSSNLDLPLIKIKNLLIKHKLFNK